MNEFSASTETTSNKSKDNTSLQAVANRVKGAAQDVQSAAVELASKSTEVLKGHAAELLDATKTMASDTTTRFGEKVAQQKGVGADYIDNLADAMLRAAKEFDAETPLAGTYVRKAASQVENAAEAVRTGNINDLVQGAQSFARNQPTAFLGLAVLAGFGVVRFLMSAPDSRSSGTAQPSALR